MIECCMIFIFDEFWFERSVKNIQQSAFSYFYRS